MRNAFLYMCGFLLFLWSLSISFFLSASSFCSFCGFWISVSLLGDFVSVFSRLYCHFLLFFRFFSVLYCGVFWENAATQFYNYLLFISLVGESLAFTSFSPSLPPPLYIRSPSSKPYAISPVSTKCTYRGGGRRSRGGRESFGTASATCTTRTVRHMII